MSFRRSCEAVETPTNSTLLWLEPSSREAMSNDLLGRSLPYKSFGLRLLVLQQGMVQASSHLLLRHLLLGNLVSNKHFSSSRKARMQLYLFLLLVVGKVGIHHHQSGFESALSSWMKTLTLSPIPMVPTWIIGRRPISILTLFLLSSDLSSLYKY